jgi:hypothetical protein
MQLLVSVRPENGRFVARLGDSDRYKMDGETAAAAVAALRQELQRIARGGELVYVDVPVEDSPPPPLVEADEDEKELMRQIVEEAYRYRDELKAAEFPE